MSNIEDLNNLPHIHLIGNPEENFYSLGRRDKEGYELIKKQITQLCMRSTYAAVLIKKLTEWSKDYNKRGSIDLSREYKAYAEGLEIPVNDLYFNLLLPEIVASFNKWLPHLLGVIPGCSSLFLWDKENQGVVHSRILDYALSGPFEKYERTILYEFSKRLKTFSYSTVGMPTPSLTTINEKGLTLALHYKHGDFFDINGDSIFSLIYQISSYCTSIQEVKKYLHGYSSIGHWGIYASDSNGNIGSFDIRGQQVYFEKFDLKEHDFLYFNNRPLVSSKEEELLQPYGNKAQCIMRKETLFKQMEKYKYSAKDHTTELLRVLTEIKPVKSYSAKKWKLSPVNPGSIQAVSMHNSLFETCHILGKAPKLYQGEIEKYSQIFKNRTSKSFLKKTKIDIKYIKGMEYISESQSSMDSGNIENAYHSLQMAIEYLADYPEKIIAEFFFLIWQYLHEDSNKDLNYIYQELLDLEGLLPDYLNDHRILFITRLNKILGHGHEPKLRSKIKDKNLRIIFDKEIKMKAVALKLLRKFTIPRIEILDIIYIYA